MSFARLHKTVTYVIAALGLWAISLGPWLSALAMIIVTVALVASWFVEGARIRDPRWSRGWTVALIAFFALQIARGLTGGSVLELGLEATAALQVSRLFNRRGAAEHQQIAALSLLMLIAATVITTQLAYGLAFFGFVIITPWMLTLGHLRAEIEASHEVDGEPDDDAIEKVLGQKQLIGGRYLLSTATLSVPLFLMTGLVFLLFPRVGLGRFAFGRENGQAVSGFGANVELGDFGVIREDPTVVMRVTPPGLPPEPPPRISLRMRGTSFDHYDGRRWTRSRDLSPRTVGRLGTHYAIPVRMPNLTDREWEVVLDPLEEPVIFLPPRTVGLQVPPRVVGGVEVGRDISIAPGLDIRYGDDDGLGLRYTAYTAEDGVDDGPLDPDLARRYLQVPEGHERVAALAREWTEGAETPEAKIRAITRRLRDSGDFTYSLRMPTVGDRRPLDVFLFEARRGHCEYFSTAAAVMLRSVGVPTRNATGFLGGRFNPYGGYYALAQGDAHSWVEAYVDGRGWVTVDATPPGRDAIEPDLGLFATVREMLDAVRTRWSNDVVSYDLRSQLQLFWRMRRWLRGSGSSSSDTPPDPAETSPSETSSFGGVSGVIGALIALAVVWLAWRWWRRRGDAEAELDPNAARAVQLIRALDGALAKLGWARPPDRTVREHADALAAAGFGGLDVVRGVVDRYVAVRYGGEALDPAELERLRRAIRGLAGRRDLFVPAAE